MQIFETMFSVVSKMPIIGKYLQNTNNLPKLLAASASGTFLLQVTYLAFSFVIRVMLARFLGVSNFGLFTYLISWCDILLVVAVLGIDRLIVREVAAANTILDWQLSAGLIRYANILVAITSMLIFLVIIGTKLLSTSMLDTSFVKQSFILFNTDLLVITLLVIPVRAFIRIRQHTMQAFGDITRSLLPEYLLQPVLFIVLILLTRMLVDNQFSVHAAIAFFLITHLVALIYGAQLLNKRMPDDLAAAKPTFAIKPWMIAAVPFLFISSMHIINSRIDIVMIGILTTSDDVGIYSVAVQLGNLVALVLTVANVTLAPTFARLYKQSDMQTLQSLYSRSARIIVLASLCIAIPMLIFGQFIMGLYGPEFRVGYLVLIIIVLAQLFNAFVGSAGTLLTMANYSWYAGMSVATSAVLNIILNLQLVPRFGIEGAAVATLSTLVVWNAMLIYFVWRKLHIVATAIG